MPCLHELNICHNYKKLGNDKISKSKDAQRISTILCNIFPLCGKILHESIEKQLKNQIITFS